jgi:RimJ/RimL family protein N-acetyltransferase
LPKNQQQRSRRDYPVEEVREAALRDGRRVSVRPTRTDDAPSLQEFFFRLRAEDIRTRFFRQLRSLTDEMAQHLCSVGYEHEMAFAAVVGEPESESERVVGSSCYFFDPRTGLADVAYMVDPEWQGVGLGRLLQARTIEYARAHGVRGFTADVLRDNTAMLAVFRRSDCHVTSHSDGSVVELQLLFDEPPAPADGATGAPSGERGITPRAEGRPPGSKPRRRSKPPRRT